MSGFVLVCTHRTADVAMARDDVKGVAHHLAPANIDAHPPDILERDALIRAVVNPLPTVLVNEHGVCLGSLFGQADWCSLGGPVPDGTFAIARHDDNFVELVSDVFASRTIWYVHDHDRFLASNSQRALVALLGDYVPCRETASWMVASGYLGPKHGWDERLRRLPGNTVARLDRESWELSIHTSHVEIEPRDLPDQELLARMRDAIFDTCARVGLDRAPSVLTLSGGVDSRAILVGLAMAGKKTTCVTWGLTPSIDDPKNDAYIARKLAARYGMKHEYLILDFPDDPVRRVFSRFLLAGEGRAEDFSGYTDGMKTWERLFASGVATVIRGDCPGWGSPYDPTNEFIARSLRMHATLATDFPEGHLVRRLATTPQELADEYYRKEGESLPHYRDRLYNQYELPTCMAAFNDVKCAYCEVINPLYGLRIVEAGSELPDHLRHLRVGYERMVGELVRDVPFAEHHADEGLDHYLGRPQVLDELLSELSSEDARRVFPTAALDDLVADLQRPSTETRSRLRRRVRGVVPERVIRKVRPAPRPRLETKRVAYRAYIASRMNAILRQDAQARSVDRSLEK